MKKILLLIVFVFFGIGVYTALGQPPPPPPQDIPIDGGLLALLIAGVTFGGVKIYKETKEK